MKKLLDDMRCIIGQELMLLCLYVFPKPERVELAQAIQPLAKAWKERMAREIALKS